MIYNVKVDEKDYKLEIVDGPKNLEVKINGRVIKIDNYNVGAGILTTLLKDNRPYEFEISKDESAYDCWFSSRKSCRLRKKRKAVFRS